jgi:hypothetical protein
MPRNRTGLMPRQKASVAAMDVPAKGNMVVMIAAAAVIAMTVTLTLGLPPGTGSLVEIHIMRMKILVIMKLITMDSPHSRPPSCVWLGSTKPLLFRLALISLTVLTPSCR